jgi:general secretion pathway protein E
MSTVDHLDHSTPVNPTLQPPERFLASVSHDFARRHLILCTRSPDDSAVLLVAPSTPPSVIHNVCTLLQSPFPSTLTDPEHLASLIDATYADQRADSETPELDTTHPDLQHLIDAADRDLLSTDGKAPVVKLLDAMLFEACRGNASDLHIQPLGDRTLIRVRIDGVLQTLRDLPASLGPYLVSRVKVLGKMDIAERRIPQDGRCTITIGSGRTIDLRISTLPTRHGERAVLRMLEAESVAQPRDFASLGMPADLCPKYLSRASRSSGIVLVTGPTGSGKTTTLYTTLRWLASDASFDRRGDLNIMTIEDPIEYELAAAGIAISQSQVNTKKGVTFASGLRHILRQDPDVVMVGEIRDDQTARTAIQASLTGHLVFSTLHTNDAASAVTRLADLGVEPYLVSASLSAVLAQRLIRRIHSTCHGSGCTACFGSGYAGRMGVYELLEISDSIRELIAQNATASAIRDAARIAGSRSLLDQGMQLVNQRVTTHAEVARVLVGLGDDITSTPQSDFEQENVHSNHSKEISTLQQSEMHR